MSDKREQYVTYQPGQLHVHSVQDTMEAAKAVAEHHSTEETPLRAAHVDEWWDETTERALNDAELTLETKSEYWHFLEVLPPRQWVQHEGAEVFCMCEALGLHLHEQHAKARMPDGSVAYATRLVDLHDRETWITREEVRELWEAEARKTCAAHDCTQEIPARYAVDYCEECWTAREEQPDPHHVPYRYRMI